MGRKVLQQDPSAHVAEKCPGKAVLVLQRYMSNLIHKKKVG